MEDWWHLLGDHLSVHLKVLPDQLSHESMLASRLLIVTCTWTLALGITVLDTSDAAAQSNQPSAARRRLTPRLSPRLTPAPAAPTPAAPPPAAPTPTPTPAPAPAAPAPVEPPADEGTNSGSFEPAAPAPAPPQTTSIPPVGTSGAPTLPFRPPVLPVFDGAPAPEGYVEESSFNGALLWGGGLTLLVTYGGSLVYGAARNFEDGLGSLAVPVLGPWLSVSKIQVDCSDVAGTLDPEQAAASYETCQQEGVDAVKRGVTLVGFGIGQMAGAIVTILGLLDREKEWVRADLAGVSLELDAYAVPGASGFVATGTF